VTGYRGIDFQESVPGVLKSLKIRPLEVFHEVEVTMVQENVPEKNCERHVRGGHVAIIAN
jgi:hypothetical protein